ncbi:MAG: family lipase [Nocardioides sp.]|uniref:SGNH/GDSL hydrolase family protein n=1 Tax=Nocardioides sp. TaxID=35761 RepID=UPI00261B4EB2|nr:SGNH/GDSL hydrolase family protein [Nocardioides sp.]MCW2835456.1 family lipase [Nocardioides sp.]
MHPSPRARRVRLSRLAAVAVLLALVATACSGSDAAEEGGFPQQSFGDLPAEIDYVAMGDSYSAGPLVTTVRSDPSGCVRSTDNYPAFLAGWLDVETYTDVTCSAADTGDFTRRQQMVDGKRVAPQLDAVSTDTDLVTLGIGGNDFGIFSSLVGCAEGCSPKQQKRLLRDAARVEARVRKVVEAITDRAPEAEVFVIGYPQVLPEDESCGAVPLTPAQLDAAAEIAGRLNGSLAAGAEGASASYVDVSDASEGHDVCAGKAAWINGPEMLPGIAAPFHPVLDGMRGVAAEVFSEITGDEAPQAERAAPPRDAVVRN